MRPIAIAALLGLATPAQAEPAWDAVRTAFFEPQSAELRWQSKPVIELAARIAARNKARREIVTGYCDADEIAAGLCPALARRRAEAVKAALIGQGMKARIIVIRTSDEPLNPGNRAENRRVVIDPV